MSVRVGIHYQCDNDHTLIFRYLLTKRGKFDSGSPAACGCGKLYTRAMFENSTAYFEMRRKKPLKKIV
jgi:hypothetical protein